MITLTHLPPVEELESNAISECRESDCRESEPIAKAVLDAACEWDADELDCHPVIVPPASLKAHLN